MGKPNSTAFCPTAPVDDLITMNALHGAFYGSAMKPADVDALLAAHTPKNHFKDVSDVYAVKWWDYRRMSPGHCFLLFTACYYKSFKLAARKVLTHRKSKQSQFDGLGEMYFDAESIWDRDPNYISGMWNAMLISDAYGMPYDWFCKLTFSTAIERNWRRLPRPHQFYTDSLIPFVIDEWEVINDERLFMARHPVFLVENYVGTPLQNAYREWAIERIASRPNPTPALAEHVFRNPQIPASEAEKHFSANALKRASLMTV